MAHAAGTSPPPPTAPLGASGAETIKEFEACPALSTLLMQPMRCTCILSAYAIQLLLLALVCCHVSVGGADVRRWPEKA